MVKRRRVILISAATVIVVAIAVVAIWPVEREPEYQGKKLSEWVQLCVKADKTLGDAAFGYTYYEVKTDPELKALRAQRDATRDVVIRLGTNSIPWLVKRLEYELPSWRWKLVSAFVRIPGAAGCDSLVRAIRGDVPIERRAKVLGVFLVMGQQGKAAVPDLQRILNDPKRSVDAKMFAKWCLDEVTPRQ